MELTHTRLLVKDYKACLTFYRDTLQFELDWGDENTNYCQFKVGSHLLALFDRNMMAASVRKSELPLEVEQMDRIALIFRVDDVDTKANELKEKGITFDMHPVNRPEWGIRVAHFRDPDGNLIEINEPIEFTG
ncbi:VOC family protein [Evansella halocellulosilytica]|uniref:VOC family protein n=1 Tax=Evansella halocellulosilytica TaxID=2011013 RepID=UPI000BB67C15|nr:VOC family protein [Evansella halocellulosilytica]